MPRRPPPPRTALVTGAARRIGRTVSLGLARDGWQVGLHCGSSLADARSLAAEIAAFGGRAEVLPADLLSGDQIMRLIPHCAERLGPVTCLVNNASVFEPDTAATMTEASWRRHLDINLTAPVLLAQSFAATFRRGSQHSPPGNIINILDQRVWKLTPQFFSYTIAKSALWTATQTLAQALAPDIRVNAVGPGPVLASIHQTAQEFAREQGATLLGRGTTPEEIARTVLYILDAPAMTGQMIVLDGGQHLNWQTPDTMASGA